MSWPRGRGRESDRIEMNFREKREETEKKKAYKGKHLPHGDVTETETTSEHIDGF